MLYTVYTCSVAFTADTSSAAAVSAAAILALMHVSVYNMLIKGIFMYFIFTFQP